MFHVVRFLFFNEFAELVFYFVDACICEVRPLVQARCLPKFFCNEEFLCGAKITESVSSSVCLCMRDYFPGDVWIWVQTLVPDVPGKNGFVFFAGVLE